MPYTKPALSHADQLQQLKNRGLIILNEPKALFLLEGINYYRLSGYWFPFLETPKTDHVFKRGATFEAAFKLYRFDRELRQMILSELEKIEVAVRAKMIYILSHSHGSFWYQHQPLFSNIAAHATTITKIQQEYLRSDEEFIKAFKLKYNDPLPPSWMITEITSFGSLSMLYKNIKPGHGRRNIAHYFGVDDATFESWLHSIVYLRNLCAHHSRFWNRDLGIRPRIPHTPRKQWLVDTSVRNNKAYFVLSMILYLLQTVNSRNTFLKKFLLLLKKYPSIDPSAMGFPRNWKHEPLWEKKSWVRKLIDQFS